MRGALALLVLLPVLFFCASCKNEGPTSNPRPSSILDEVRSKRELTIGYAIYPPYIQKNLRTGELGGFSIEVAREMAKAMNVTPIFVETSWNTFISDIKIGKFQLFVGPVFHSIQRLMEVDFPEPYGFFSAVAGLVKKDDNRFNDVMDLNNEGVVLSVPQSWTSHEYAQQNLIKAKIKAFEQDDPNIVFADLLGGNCDVALADAPTVQQYLENNPNQNVKPLFLDKPVSFSRAGFMIRKGDPSWLEFISSSIRVMRTQGVLRSIANRFRLYSFEEQASYVKQ